MVDIGSRYGSLTVVGEGVIFEHQVKRDVWAGRNVLIIKCDCGKRIGMSARYFGKKGQACLSCSTKKNSAQNISKFKYVKKTTEERLAHYLKYAPGESTANYEFKHYSACAKKRGYEWSLTFEQFKSIVALDCEYCGAAPSMVRSAKTQIKEINEHTTFIRNGIDRVNSELGYVTTNVVPCCKVCNMAKRDMSAETFIAMAKRIAAKAA